MSTKTIWDKHGNSIGEDVITTDQDGLIHITHYDTAHNRVGRSYQTRDHRGEVYMIHEDDSGQVLARSTIERDWWGDYYLKTEQTHHGWRQKKETSKTHSVSQKEDDEEGSSPVVALLYGIVMIGIKIYIALLGYALVVAAAMPLVLWILMMSLNRTGNATLGWFWAFSIILITYFPYVGILLYRRWKKKINWKDFFLAVLRWAIIGPLAYWKLARQMKQEKLPRPGLMPVSPEGKMFCRNCGCISDKNDRFCKKCGADLRKTPQIHREHFPVPGEES